MAVIRVLIVDDHPVLRRGLRHLLCAYEDIEVVGEAENGRIAVQLARKLKPGIVIMDIGMPELNGMDASRQILAELPGTKIIALSMYSDRRFVTEMFKAGVSGYLLKDCAFDELAQAIKSVGSNQKYVSPAIACTVIDSYLHKSGLTGPVVQGFNQHLLMGR